MKRYEKAKTHQERRQIAADIALALHDSNKDPADWWRKHAANHLAQFDTPNSLFKNYLMIGAWACCDACKAIDGKKFTLKEAQASQLLPQPGCTHRVNKAGFASCSCDWEIDMDSYRAARPARSN
jgi:hypothetical protein